MKKAISCLLLGLLMCCAFALPSFALDGGIQTYASLCDECGKGEVTLVETSYGPWYTVGYTSCSSGNPVYRDTIKNRSVRKTYLCDNCGSGWSSNYTEQDTFYEH